MSDLIDRQAALDAIKFAELGREYDEVEKVQIFNPWHRVEDELPEPHEYVLCCGKKGGCFVGWTLDNADVVKANGHGRAFVHGGNARTFTHWTPLPEPPKEEA